MPIEIRARDFGPLEEAAIGLKPLTAFSGPNNAGKPFLGMLVYAVCHPSHGSGAMRFRPVGAVRPRRRLPVAHVAPHREHEDRLGASLLNWAEQDSSSGIPFPEDTLEHFNFMLEGVVGTYGYTLAYELERCFGCSLSELVRRGASGCGFSMSVTQDDPPWSIELRLKESAPNVTVHTHPSAAE